ncbi:hypothetical protein ACRRTK_001112 [Alexandromys fortis]
MPIPDAGPGSGLLRESQQRRGAIRYRSSTVESRVCRPGCRGDTETPRSRSRRGAAWESQQRSGGTAARRPWNLPGHLDSFIESSLHPSSTEQSTVLGIQMLSEQSLSQLQGLLITQTCSPLQQNKETWKETGDRS